ncbi:MAG TPA: ferrous iron transport protein A [Planctomycetes bacterium]|nr:ferrous iron transport protein A [Planctomycetota bacterium]
MTSNEIRSLSDLRIGESGVIDDILAPRSLTRRLLEMGLTGGTRLELIRLAPLGDPLEVSVRGYRLTLRRDEAQAVRLRM